MTRLGYKIGEGILYLHDLIGEDSSDTTIIIVVICTIVLIVIILLILLVLCCAFCKCYYKPTSKGESYACSYIAKAVA